MIRELKSKEERKFDIIVAAIKLFSRDGFYATRVPDIAKAVGMSAGNIYNYFSSKEDVAKCAIRYCSNVLAKRLRAINEMPVSTKKKIELFVNGYFEEVEKFPELIEFFLRIYLANREIFSKECDNGYECAAEFVEEVQKLLDRGVEEGELEEENFHIAFSMLMGPLGCFAFMRGENVLEKPVGCYASEIAKNIYLALCKSERRDH
ncbi:MAG: TetR/AcrR family transcriptional regulator [Hydrogenimonas sp.]|nr:MAG: TetR/AcrR family transcriptional regulator [Hydrogenimonas sp.]